MLRIKKLDIFVLKSFLLLFAGTFFICLFIFMMQFLWRYVDELVGKGLEINVLAQFFFYSGLTLIPLSLPLAILLAALMTFGNFGERYELLSMKAAGIRHPLAPHHAPGGAVLRFPGCHVFLFPKRNRASCAKATLDSAGLDEAEIARSGHPRRRVL